MTSIIPEETRIAMEVAARDRLDRLESLTEAQRLAVLTFLACSDGETFDDVVDQVTLEEEDDDPDSWQVAAPYCLLCGSNLAVFPDHGPDWQHFRGDPNSTGPFEVFPVDHEPFVAWRTSGGDSAAA